MKVELHDDGHDHNDSVTDENSTAQPQWMTELDIFQRFYFPPVIVLIGVTGNVLMYLLMVMPEFRNTASSIYMRGIALTDSVYLISRVMQRFVFNLVPSLLQGDLQRPVCMEFYILFTFGQAASLLLLVAMSLDRAFAILFPMRYIGGNVLKRAKLHAGIATVLAFGYSLTFNLNRSLIPHLLEHGWPCPFYFHPPYDVVITHLESALGYSCLLLLIFTNILIIRTIIGSRRRRAEMQAQVQGQKKQNGGEDDNHMLIMLLTISISYLIAYLLPRMKNAYYFANEVSNVHERQLSNAISTITVMIEHGNFALNFYMYALPSAKFRNALMILLGCRKKPERDSSSSIRAGSSNERVDSSNLSLSTIQKKF